MTVSSTNARSGPYTGNGITTVFPRDFYIADEDQLQVFVTVDGVRSEVLSGISKDSIGQASGNVTFSTAPASGTIIELIRTTSLLQSSDYNNQGRVQPEVIEGDLDYAAMRDQELVERVVTMEAALTSAGADLDFTSVLPPKLFFNSVADFVADTLLTYSAGQQTSVKAGDIVRAGEYAFLVQPEVFVASYAITPANGVKFLPAGFEADAAAFGVVYDAIYTGGRWTGTDATAALQKALDWADAVTGCVVISGTTHLAHQAGRNFNKITTGNHYCLKFLGQGMLGDDFDPAEVIDGNGDKNVTMFGVADSETATETTVTARSTFRLINPKIRGIAQDNKLKRRQHVLRIMGYSIVDIVGGDVKWISGNFSRSDYNGSWFQSNGVYEEIASGVARSRYTPNIKITSNIFRGVYDDVIDPHSTNSNTASPELPVRYDILISGNSFERCKGINVLGGVGTRVVFNNFHLCTGPISVWARSSDAFEGQGVTRDTIIAHNSITDTLRNLDYSGVDDNSPAPPTALVANTGHAILVAGADAVGVGGQIAPWSFDAANNNFARPYDAYVELDAGPEWAQDQNAGTSGTISTGVMIMSNTIKRTLPAGSTAFGAIGSAYGDTALAITEDTFADRAIVLLPGLRNAVISKNEVRGHRTFIYFQDDAQDREYVNVLIEGNHAEDFLEGISRRNGNAVSWRVTIRGNTLVGDPFWRSSERDAVNNDGSWNDPGTVSLADIIGINLDGVRGGFMEINTFAECQVPWVLSDPNATDWREDWVCIGNRCLGYFQGEGWNDGNIGVGYVYLSAYAQCAWLEVEPDPTLSDYGMLREGVQPKLQSAATPATDTFYLKGHQIMRQNPVTTGGKTLFAWINKTTGRAGGYDFEPMYATNT